MRREVDDGAVAARAGDGVAGQILGAALDAEAFDVDGPHHGGRDALLALRLDHRTAADDANVARARGGDQIAVRLVARIDDRHHATTGIMPVKRSAVAVVVGRRQHQGLAGDHAVAADEGRHGAGNHVARNVVAPIHQRPLLRTGGQHDALGAHLVQTRPGLAATVGLRCEVGQVLGAALMQGDEVVIVIAIGGGARQQQHVG